MNARGFGKIIQFIIIIIGLSCTVLASDVVELDIDFAANPKLLPYQLTPMRHTDWEMDRLVVHDEMQVYYPQRPGSDSVLIIHLFNPHQSLANPATVGYNTLDKVLDHDPINVTFFTFAFYHDSRANKKAIAAACYRNDSAFVARVVPGENRHDLIFLATGTDHNGDDEWTPGFSIPLVEDYDYDGREEVFVYLGPGRDLEPRILYCLDMEDQRIEWSLPVAPHVNANDLLSCRDAANPAVVFTCYNVCNGVSDDNFSDRYCYLAKVNHRGEIVYNRILSEEHGGKGLWRAEAGEQYYLFHALPLISPENSDSLPPSRYQLSKIDRDCVRLATIDLDRKMIDLWLSDYREDGSLDLYTLSSDGAIRIYDTSLGLLAQSGATNLTHFIDTLCVSGESAPAFAFRSADGLQVYSSSFRRLLQLNENIHRIHPVRYDGHGNVMQFVASHPNATWIMQVEQRKSIDLVRTFLWVYQNYFLLALIALLVVLVTVNAMRRKAVVGMAEHQTRFQQLFQSIPEAVALLDSNSRIVDINPVFEELFGYRLEEVQGRDINDVVVPENLRSEGRSIDTDPERYVYFDTVRHRKDGKLINISISGSNVIVGSRIVGRLALYKDITERIRAEDVLRASEEKYRLLVESVRSAIAVIDYNGVFLFVNELAAQAHGVTADEMVGQTMWNLFPKEVADSQMCRVRQVIETRKEFAGESQIPLLSELHWYDNILQPYVDAQGEVVAALLIATDITESKAAELALRESDERLRQVVDNMPVMMLAFDNDGCFVVWNRECERVTGYTADEMVNNPRAMEILCPNDAVRASILAGWREKGNDYRDLEWEITCRDGTRRITSWSDISDHLPIPGWAAWTVGIDVTERNKARQQLEQSKEKYQHLFENAQIGMFRIQMKPERLLEVNKKLASMLGYTREEMLTRKFSDIWVDLEHLESSRRELLRDGEQNDLEFVARTAGGDERTLSVSVRLYQPLGYFEGSALDITDRNRAIEALRESEEKYRSLQENLPVGIYRASAKGSAISGNSAMLKMYGFDSLDELLSVDPTATYCDPSQRTELVRQLQEKGSVTDFELQMRRKDGSTFWVSTSNRAIYDENGEFVAYDGIDRDITERKLIEKELRKGEEKWRSLVENIPDFVISIDRNGTILSINRVMTRGSSEDFEGSKIFESLHPDHHEYVRDVIKRVFDSGQAAEYEVLGKNDKNEFAAWYEAKMVPMVQDDGRVTEAILIATDRTDRRQAEAILKESEEKYRLLIEQSADNIYLMDVETGRVLESNAALRKLLGYSAEEMSNLTVYDFIAHDREDINDKISKVIEDQHLFLRQRKYRRKDGSEIEIEASASAIQLKGKPALCIVSRDITERLKAERALTESEERFRSLAETTPAAIFILDGNVIVYSNPMLAAITAFSKAELLGMRFCKLVHPDQRDLVRERAIARDRGEDVPSRYEMHLATKSGDEKWVDFSVVQIDYRGKPAVIGTMFDITERKKAESELQIALQQKYDQAKEIAGGVAHEVYNALFPATATLDKLRNRLSDNGGQELERDEKLVRLAETAVIRAIQLTEEVTRFSKLETERTVDDLELGSVLQDVISSNPRFLSDSVHLSTKIPDDCRFRMNRVHAFSLFNNIIHNGLDSLQEADGEKLLTIEAFRQSRQVRVEITDTGGGIEPDILPRIFDPFFSTKPRTGTGLGLAICRKILDIHGGSISVDSGLDTGVKFVILLQSK